MSFDYGPAAGMYAKLTCVEAFTTYTGKIAVIPGEDIDTDRIIPARFLTRVSRSGYGELLFHDVRGSEFILDQPAAAGSTILVVGSNFGCGSSREHAVWAIQQGGYRAVIAKKTADAPGFSDIFRQNAANCGLLLAEVSPEDHVLMVNAGTGAFVTLDLPNQTIEVGQVNFRFEINEATKLALIEGLDLIGTTLVFSESISAFEANHDSFAPVF